MPKSPEQMEINDEEEVDQLAWFYEQLDQLAEHVEVNKPEFTPVQLARLLRELCKGRDWRHGAWR